jgi:uncharacterized linocin/CFP29 family protein
MSGQYGLSKVGVDTGSLTTEEIRIIENAVIDAARPQLIARRIFAPAPIADIGVRTWRQYSITDMGQAVIDMDGLTDSGDRVVLAEKDVTVPMISKNFDLFFRDIASSRRYGTPLDVMSARNAAIQCAEEEDKLCLTGEYTGWRAYGIQGLTTATGRQAVNGGDWSATAVTEVGAAIALLQAYGFYGPYAAIMPSTFYGQLLALISNTGTLLLKVIQEMVDQVIVSDNLFAADGDQDSVVVCQPGFDNFVLGIAQNPTTFMHQKADMNYRGKVWEVAVPYIKRPKAIVEINTLT